MHQTDPQLVKPPESTGPEWAEVGVPFGDALLRSGPNVNGNVAGDSPGAFGGGEIVHPKRLPSPVMPSKREIAEHNTTHTQPRSGCEHCNAGNAVAAEHVERADHDSENVAVIGIGYASVDNHDEIADTRTE